MRICIDKVAAGNVIVIYGGLSDCTGLSIEMSQREFLEMQRIAREYRELQIKLRHYWATAMDM